MIEKGVIRGICSAAHHYAKANNKYKDNYDENKKSSYINYWDVYNLYGGQWCKSSPHLILSFHKELW